MNGLAVLHRAAALGFASVLAGAASVASLAAALAFAGVFAGAVVGFAFVLLVVGKRAGGDACLVSLDGGGADFRDETAAEDAGDCCASEDGFDGGVTLHDVCLCCFFGLFSARTAARTRGVELAKLAHWSAAIVRRGMPRIIPKKFSLKF